MVTGEHVVAVGKLCDNVGIIDELDGFLGEDGHNPSSSMFSLLDVWRSYSLRTTAASLSP